MIFFEVCLFYTDPLRTVFESYSFLYSYQLTQKMLDTGMLIFLKHILVSILIVNAEDISLKNKVN